MMIPNDIDQIVAEFEATWKPKVSVLHDFIRQRDAIVGSIVQIQLLRKDLRLRLLAGMMPSSSNYERHFPHLEQEIDKLVAEEVISIANQASPVEDQFGELPQQLDNYEIVRQVGRDRVSVHYEANQVSLDRKVSVRVLLFPTSDAISKACRVALLEHPNCESTLDVVKIGSTFIVVSQFESGTSLSKILDNRSGVISARRCVSWIRSVGEALLESHRLDVSHLNISPENIIVRDNDEAVLINANFEQRVPQLDACLGDVSHEQLPFPYRSITRGVGGHWAPACDDTVALGLILFQLLTRLPLESFYRAKPLPQESMRLKKLIADQLLYADNIEPELKSICKRATLGVMEDCNTFSLAGFCTELAAWERPKVAIDIANFHRGHNFAEFAGPKSVSTKFSAGSEPRHSIKTSVARGLQWIGELRDSSGS